MKRYFELFFRHPVLFSLPTVVALLAGVAYGLKAPPAYIASATLFCDAPLPYASTLQQPGPPGNATPCVDKSGILQEFLHSDSFDNKVAARAMHEPQGSGLAPSDVGKAVTVAAPGAQILRLWVTAATPAEAAGTAQAVIDEFLAEIGAELQQRAQTLISSSKAQLDSASAALADARAALDSYLLTNTSSSADVEQTLLTDEVTLAQQQRDTAATNYNQARLAPTKVDPTTLHVLDAPQLPTTPKSRKKPLILGAAGGLLGGGVITILALVLLMAQDRSVREEQDLEPTLEVVGSIPQFAKGVLSPAGKRPESEPQKGFWTPPGLVESCRAVLRHLERQEHGVRSLDGAALWAPSFTGIGAVGGGRSSRAAAPHTITGSIGVTSSLRGEGRSTVAAGIAAATRQAYGLRVILVELDLEHPSYARQFGIDSGPGVAELLRDGASIADCLQMPDDDTVGVLVAGDSKDDPAGLFARLRSSSVVKDLGDLCDVVVADLPPVLPGGEAASLGELFSSVLFVVRSGAAPVSEVRRALEDLDKRPPVILNCVESSLPRPLRALLAG